MGCMIFLRIELIHCYSLRHIYLQVLTCWKPRPFLTHLKLFLISSGSKSLETSNFLLGVNFHLHHYISSSKYSIKIFLCERCCHSCMIVLNYEEALTYFVVLISLTFSHSQLQSKLFHCKKKGYACPITDLIMIYGYSKSLISMQIILSKNLNYITHV